MKQFRKIISGYIDTEKQKEIILTEKEQLIFKPHKEGLKSLSKEEIEQYLSFDIAEMRKTKINSKTIVICEETQKFINNNKEIILKNLNKEEKENER